MTSSVLKDVKYNKSKLNVDYLFAIEEVMTMSANVFKYAFINHMLKVVFIAELRLT